MGTLTLDALLARRRQEVLLGFGLAPCRSGPPFRGVLCLVRVGVARAVTFKRKLPQGRATLWQTLNMEV
jgi:hypothetical protein